MSTGIICDVKQVYSQPEVIQRRTGQTPDKVTKLEEDIRKVIDELHSLSAETESTRSFSSTGVGLDLDAYYNTLSHLYDVFQPLLREKLINDLPKNLVCILSERPNCGLEAELTKTVGLELGRPLLVYASSVKSQTCSIPNGDSESNSFARAYVKMGESATEALTGFRQMFLNILKSLPLSGNLINNVSNLLDAIVIYFSKIMATYLQVPMDYFKLALQFGIKLPSLDEREKCDQGKHIIISLNCKLL